MKEKIKQMIEAAELELEMKFIDFESNVNNLYINFFNNIISIMFITIN